MKKSDDQRIRAPRLKSRAQARANEFLFLRVRVSRRERRANESSLKLYALFLAVCFGLNFFLKAKMSLGCGKLGDGGVFAAVLRVKNSLPSIILKYARVVYRRYTTLSQKKPPLFYVRRNARAFLLFFFSLLLSLSLHPLLLSLSVLSMCVIKIVPSSRLPRMISSILISLLWLLLLYNHSLSLSLCLLINI